MIRVESPDPRCVAMSTVAFPPAFDFVPGGVGRVIALDFAPPTLVPIDVEPVPPEIADFPKVCLYGHDVATICDELRHRGVKGGGLS